MSGGPRLPFLLALSGIAILCAMDALLKKAGAHYPTFQLAFLRFVAGFLWTASAVLILRPAFASGETIRANSMRGVIGAVTAALSAITHEHDRFRMIASGLTEFNVSASLAGRSAVFVAPDP